VANKEIKNILLVEGFSDIKFFETLLKFEDLKNKTAHFNSIQFDEIGGSDDAKLEKAIRGLVTDIRKSPIHNFGIILDLDEFSNDERLAKIIVIFEKIFGNTNVVIVNKNNFDLKINDSKTINVSCYFIENDLVTNLELLLKKIATENPLAANCLKTWYDCSLAAGRKIRKSDYLKFWREVYVRYDYCADKDLLKHANENCTTEKSFENLFKSDKPNAWDFENKLLDNLKNYLTNFSSA
jgi:hypothetical protein